MRRACVSFLSLVLVFICGACSPSVQTSAPPSSTSSLKDVEDVKDAVYMLDTTSGYFSREQGDEVVICRLEDSWIRRVYAPLGVLGLING